MKIIIEVTEEEIFKNNPVRLTASHMNFIYETIMAEYLILRNQVAGANNSIAHHTEIRIIK